MKKILCAVCAVLLLSTLILSGCMAKKEVGEDAPKIINQDKKENRMPQGTSAPEMTAEEPSVEAEGKDDASSPYQSLKSVRNRNAGMYDEGAEEYGEYSESPFLSPAENPLSTFSIDVDTASYSNIRRFLIDGCLPPVDAVRVEECINYFNYEYNQPKSEHPVSVDVTMSDCPWNEGRLLARVAVQGKELDLDEAVPSNFVFLLDVSGSMNSPDKLPLLVSGMKMLADELDEEDTVSIVVYAGASGVVLEGVPGSENRKIERALDRLSAGGSTAGGEGILRAYDIAEEYFIKKGNNRVILCTDGDFNVGVSSMEGLEDLIEEKRESGVFLSVLGFGTGNIKDNKMETLADKGNGNYAYIDSLMEAKKVLVKEMGGTLYTIAKDVKIQVEFNPQMVQEYRLVGYDNRRLRDEDFNDDTKDAGEMGAGHTVTAFYEIIPQGVPESGNVDDLRYQDKKKEKKPITFDGNEEWMWVKLRYKKPDGMTSKRMDVYVTGENYTQNPGSDFNFATAVAEYALLLKGSEYKGDADFDSLIERARENRGKDEDGYRSQFVQLAETAQILMED